MKTIALIPFFLLCFFPHSRGQINTTVDSTLLKTDTLPAQPLKPATPDSSVSIVNWNSHWPEYPAFQMKEFPDTVIPGSFNLRLRSTSFFKNNEFKNNFIYGQSLVGINFEPVVEFHPDKRTTIRAGSHFLKYWGRDSFDRILPIISVRFDASEHFSLVFGTLYGTAQHGLVEPLQNFENYLLHNYENGIQLLIHYPNLHSDIWLNWEQFIKVGDPFPEIFTAAANNDFLLFQYKRMTLTAPFSAVFRHTGGEIDTYWVPGGTKLNLLHGLRLHFDFGKGFFRNAYGVQNFLEFVEVNPGQHITIPYGHASYTRAGITTRLGGLEAGYWQGEDFQAPLGMPLFLSTSVKDPTYYQTSRRMLTFKYQYQFNLTDYLRFALRFEPYYYFDTGRTDHSWSVYLVLDEDFFVGRLRKPASGT